MNNNDLRLALAQTNAEAEELRCKIEKINLAILERFNANGIDDIVLPEKVSLFSFQFLFWLVTNAVPVVKLVKEILNAIKAPCITPITYHIESDPATNVEN